MSLLLHLSRSPSSTFLLHPLFSGADLCSRTYSVFLSVFRLDEGNLPEDMNLMEDYLQLVNHEYQRWQEDKEQAWAAQPQRPPPFSVSQLSLIEIRCATPRCTFYVSVDTQPHCHECFEKRQATTGGGGRMEGVVQAKVGGVQGVMGGSENDVNSRGGRTGSPTSSTSGRGVVVSSPRSAPPTAPSLSLYSETHAMKCKTPGCLFTLSVEHDGLCERCFNSRQNPGAPGPGTAPAGLSGPNGGPKEPPPPGEGSSWAQWGACEVQAERCGMCRQETLRTFNGLCPTCMQRPPAPERGDPQQSNPRTEASSSAWSQTRDAERPCLTLTPGHTSAWQTPLARPCKRSGCQFFGTPEKLGFCTICYVDYQTNHRKFLSGTGKVLGLVAFLTVWSPCSLCVSDMTPPPPAPAQSRHGLEAGFQNASKCRGPGCGAVGKAMLEGYCDKCYVKEQSARLNQAAHRTTHSPPAVMVGHLRSLSLITWSLMVALLSRASQKVSALDFRF